jgi:hypothetical protein
MTTRFAWLLLTLMLGVALVAGVALVFNGMHFPAPLHVSINGEDVFTGFDFDHLSTASKLALAGGLVLALLAAIVIVPIALLMLLSVFLLIALTLLGLPLIAMLTMLALLMSPLLLIGWLLWRALAS